MRAEEKSAVKNSVGRLIFVLLSVIIQVVWIAVLFIRLNAYSTGISLCTTLIAFVVVIRLYGKPVNAAFKMPWIILILIFPILGLCLFTLLGHSNVTKKMQKRFEFIDQEIYAKLQQDPRILKELEKKDFAIANQARYIADYAPYPIYQNTDIEFYADTSEGFEAQKEALKKAEKFIFMEYHAIEESRAFLELKSILTERAKHGVEVRIFYDDIGSIGFINTDFVERLRKEGIECRIFNPIMPFLNMFMNNRDHRKITVIDGKVGFTGGYNLADEYFNFTHPYGYWKDTGVRIEGEAVRSFTLMFLEMWNVMEKTDRDYEKYLPVCGYQARERGFIQPYADSPLDGEYVGENIYMNMIKNAKHEIYFTTPYLIISDEMNRELGLAAKRGVDVRIVTPGIPDKKMIYQITRSYYANLVKSGVRIYEYTPGFLHSKQCVSDGKCAVVGTINMDYRSLYLHFENGVYFYGYAAVKKIKCDFDNLFVISREVTEEYKEERKRILRFSQCILRLFSPLL